MIVKGFSLIKVQSTERINDLQNGLIYMNSLVWYRKHENDNGDVVVGDSFEAMFHVNKGKLLFCDGRIIYNYVATLSKVSYNTQIGYIGILFECFFASRRKSKKEAVHNAIRARITGGTFV